MGILRQLALFYVGQLRALLSLPAFPNGVELRPRRQWRYFRAEHEGKTKSWREVVSKLTGRCNNAHANGGTHASGAALSGAVDPTRIPAVAAEHPLGQWQRHHQHFAASLRDSVDEL